MKNRRRKILLLIVFLSLFILDALLIFKPARAMVPPPASRIWQWLLDGNGQSKSQMVKVTVTWQEGSRPEKVELKTILKDVR